jgi:hypothetical protein
MKVSALTAGGVPVRERLSRLKSEVHNEDDAALTEFEQAMRGALDELERSYRASAGGASFKERS